MRLERALYEYMAADFDLTNQLNLYQSAPAIFTDTVPEEAEFPFIVVNSVSDVPLDALVEEGRQVVRDFACYAANRGSTQQVVQITERLRALFHRQSVPVDGYSNFITTIVGISQAPTDRTVIGRIVSVRFSLRKLPRV
jgi:hypothetical protein